MNGQGYSLEEARLVGIPIEDVLGETGCDVFGCDGRARVFYPGYALCGDDHERARRGDDVTRELSVAPYREQIRRETWATLLERLYAAGGAVPRSPAGDTLLDYEVRRAVDELLQAAIA